MGQVLSTWQVKSSQDWSRQVKSFFFIQIFLTLYFWEFKMFLNQKVFGLKNSFWSNFFTQNLFWPKSFFTQKCIIVLNISDHLYVHHFHFSASNLTVRLQNKKRKLCILPSLVQIQPNIFKLFRGPYYIFFHLNLQKIHRHGKPRR